MRELHMGSALGIILRRIENPTYISYVYSALLRVDDFKHATLPIGITQRGPVSISCNIRQVVFEKLCSQTPFYIFVNQIVCVDSKCTCLTHSMLHMVIITNDILQ